MGAFPKCFCSAIVPSVWCCSLKCPSIVFFSRGYCQSHTQTTHIGAVTYSELRWAALAWSEHFQKKCSWWLNWSIFLLIRTPILICCSFVISVAVWECDAAIKTPMFFSYSFFFKFRIQNTFFCEHTSELKQFWSPSQQKNNRKMKDEESDRWKNLPHGYVGNEHRATWVMIQCLCYSLTVVINWAICEVVVFNPFKVLFVQNITTKICSHSRPRRMNSLSPF